MKAETAAVIATGRTPAARQATPTNISRWIQRLKDVQKDAAWEFSRGNRQPFTLTTAGLVPNHCSSNLFSAAGYTDWRDR